MRGYRIELQEIEQVLMHHACVREAVVLAHLGDAGDSHLVAYVVGGSDAEAAAVATTGELRAHAREQLPEYMVPSRFVMLDELPLTPNGKLDRKKLSAHKPGNEESQLNYVAPRTPSEEKLARMWAELLKVERVGVHDNFFEVGGHSLLATQLISRIRTEWELELPVRRLFETPTVAGLAQLLGETQTGNEAMQKVSMSENIIPADRGEKDVNQLLADFDLMTVEEIEALLASEA